MDRFSPPDWPTVIPRLVASDAQQLVEFVIHVFSASGQYESERPTILKIRESVIMINEAGVRDPMKGFLYVYVQDTDETYRRALEAGARSLEAPANRPYGDYRCMVADKWGNIWQIATHRPTQE